MVNHNHFFELRQQKINFSFFELHLPDDAPVYTLKKTLEEIDFSSLLAQYSSKGRSGYNPIMMYAFYDFKGEKLSGEVLDDLHYQFILRLAGLLDTIGIAEASGESEKDCRW